MNNYDEIAREAIKKVVGEEDYKKYCSNEVALKDSYGYKCAYEAAKLQAERFNKDLDNSLIESLNKEDIC